MLFFYRINLVLFSLITGLPLSLRTMRIGRVEQHGRADAILTFGAFQDIVVHATVATPPESSSSVKSENVTGTYPSSVFIFITAAPEVRLNTFAFGQRMRASWKVMSLMRFAIPKPRKSGMHDQAGGSHVLLVSP